ncbi:hypothetical protein BGX28_009181 [Mortierella sp. GBA30]|nr:hypothetical protein BGX28_009181 [Mortierella sp. GBA30]
MPPKTILSIVAIPELVAIIAQFLTARELARCLAACRRFSSEFESYFWENFHRTYDICSPQYWILVRGLPAPAVLAKSQMDSGSDSEQEPSERARFRRVKAQVAFVPKGTKASLCTNVRRIAVVPSTPVRNPISAADHHLVTLIHHNHSLTHLDMRIDFLGAMTTHSEKFIESLSNLQHLRYLTVRGKMISSTQTFALLRASLALPQLSEMYCIFDMEYDGQKSEDQVAEDIRKVLREAVKARTHDGCIKTKIKAFKAPEDKNRYDNFLYPILKSDLLDLETFEIPWIRKDEDTKRFKRTIREYCPNIRHLTYRTDKVHDNCSRGDRLLMRSAAIISSGCSDLRTFRLHNLEVDRPDNTLYEAITDLVEYHMETLETFELDHCGKFDGEEMAALLCSLRNLKRFWVLPSMYLDRGMSVAEAVHSEWLCLGLKELCVVLNRRDRYGYANSADSRECAKRFYQQLGRLTELEILALGTEEGRKGNLTVKFGQDLTLARNGHLRELAGLRKLRHLNMMNNLWEKMGQPEVEFMDKHWPVLNEISFDVSAGSDMKNQPHWRWLKRRRPYLQFTTDPLRW